MLGLKNITTVTIFFMAIGCAAAPHDQVQLDKLAQTDQKTTLFGQKIDPDHRASADQENPPFLLSACEKSGETEMPKICPFKNNL